MFVKRFVANDMKEAVKKISAEFGPNAVILQNKSIRKKGLSGLFAKKMVEVIAAYEPDRVRKNSKKPAAKTVKNKKPTSAKAADKTTKTRNTSQNNKIQQSVDEEKTKLLSLQVEELKDTIADFSNKIRIVNKEITHKLSSDVLSLYSGMIERDVKEEISKDIVEQIQNVQSRKDVDTKTIARQLIMDRLGEPVPLKLKQFKQNILLFVGPTGTGKTTTLAKMAGKLKFGENLDIALINTDTYRVGAMEQIKIYSEIMNIPLITVYSPEELKEAIKSLEDKDAVLIDTAGKSIKNEKNRNELGGIVEAAGADEVFLLLSVVTGGKALRDIICDYSFIQDYKLIITKLDEVGAWGNVLNIADYTKKPLSYITMGQNVPDDFQKADMQILAENIMGIKEASL